MQAEAQLTHTQFTSKSFGDDSFHGGHIALVVGVSVALLFFSFIKNPALFNLNSRVASSGSQTTSKSASAPKYYAYTASPLPAVLGDNTETSSQVSVLNEDGSISSISDVGQVLGVNTNQDLQPALDKMHFRTVPNSPQAVRGYLDYVSSLEDKYLETGELEAALEAAEGQKVEVTSTLNKMQQLTSALEKMYVPEDALLVHKLTLAQYSAARDLLQNFSRLNDDPELVTAKLGMLMTASEQLASAQQDLLNKYGLL